jgi:hypothetical protein
MEFCGKIYSPAPKSPSGSYGKEEEPLPLQGIEPLLLGRPATSLVVTLTEMWTTKVRRHIN